MPVNLRVMPVLPAVQIRAQQKKKDTRIFIRASLIIAGKISVFMPVPVAADALRFVPQR